MSRSEPSPRSTALSLPVLPTGDGQRRGLAEALRRGLGDDDGSVVRFGRHDRMLYSTDASIYQVEPLGVVVPRSIDEAVEAIRICAEFEVPLLPRGGGTALAGQSVNRAIVIDLSQRCRRIIAIDVEQRLARVEPGVVLDQLNGACLPHGLMFGPDVATSSHATLGGMIGNNSAGAWSIRYGRTVEHLVGVDIALADGRRLRLDEGAALRDPLVRELSVRVAAIVRELAPLIRQRFPRIRRHVDGYNLDLLLDQLERSPDDLAQMNLAHLICGSEGTLATTLEATVNLVPRPRSRGLAIAAFPDVDGAMDSLRAILATGPAAVELVDDVVIAMALANNECRPFVEVMPKPGGRTPGAVLYVEYFADTIEEVAERFGALASALPGVEIARHVDPAAMQAAWRLRKSGEPLLHAIPGARKPVTFVEDTAVDPSRLPEFVREFRAIVTRHGTTAAYYAHASVGCLHIRPLVCLRSDGDLRIMSAIAEEVADLVKRYDGALSGEHGDGRVRSPLLERYFGLELCDGFRRIKAILDPQGRMNPGNITEPGRITDHLRVRPQREFVTIPATPTFYRYEREQGFDHAIEMCNGAGICRRLTPGGTMCPSYRALLDERHATRGRGNALRLAITGQLGGGTGDRAAAAPSWNDAGTLDTLRLCLSCKACKTECPSNVDIAKLRSEYLAHGIESTGASLATLAIGNVRTLNGLASMMPRLATAVAQSAPARWLAERVGGIDRRRSLPPFARPLHGWMRARPQPDLPADAPRVILLPDCFTVYSEPHIGQAAVRSLEACGYRVILPEPSTGVGCCGRSMMSVGMLRQAVRTVRDTATALRDQVREHAAMAIVGCEPSCISALRDDWLELDLGDHANWIRGLAAQSALVEEFIDDKWDAHPRRPELHGDHAGDEAAQILLHGHCHQKALWGAESSARLLRRVAGERVTVLQTGCCGMAGSFGMTADRYDLSMQIGELELLPALRAAPAATVCAPGTSCRHQIHDGAHRQALHPIQLFDSAISPT